MTTLLADYVVDVMWLLGVLFCGMFLGAIGQKLWDWRKWSKKAVELPPLCPEVEQMIERLKKEKTQGERRCPK